jgi:hypothetical protein
MTDKTTIPGKLGYVTPPEVREKMRASAHREGTFEFGFKISHDAFENLYPKAQAARFKRGYNYILNDTKIAVHAATLGRDRHWHYTINKNVIADNFCLLAFERDETFTLVRAYMVPASRINHLTGMSISSRDDKRWSSCRLAV